MTSPLIPRSKGHAISSGHQKEHGSQESVDSITRPQIPKKENSVEVDNTSLSDRGIEPLILEAMNDLSLHTPRQESRGENDSGLSSGNEFSDSDSFSDWEEVVGEEELLRSKGYIHHQRQHLLGLIDSLASLNGNSSWHQEELNQAVGSYIQTIRETETEEQARSIILTIRRTIRDKLPHISREHKGWLYNGVNYNRDSLQECVSALTLEVLGTLPQVQDDYGDIGAGDGILVIKTAAYLKLGSQISSEQFDSDKDYQEFHRMCQEEALDLIVASGQGVKTIKGVIFRFEHEPASISVFSLTLLSGLLQVELFESADEYQDCQKMCRELVFTKILNPHETMHDLSVSKKSLDAINFYDQESSRWGRYLQEMRAACKETDKVTICRQSQVDLKRQRLELKERGKLVVDNTSARDNPASKEAEENLLIDVESYIKNMNPDQSMQMLSVMNQTLFNSMTDMLDIALRGKLGSWGQISIAKCDHGIEVDKQDNGTVVMKLTLEAVPNLLASIAPDKIIKYDGASKATMVRHVTIKPGEDMIISDPEISLTLEQGTAHE